MNRKAKIYTAFPSSGLFGSTQTYPLHHPDEKVLTNEEILDEIDQRCEDVEFVGSTAVDSPEYTMANVQAQKQGLDGVLYFGALPEELTELDLPIVAVYPLWGQWQQPFKAYGGRVLTATLPIVPDASAATFSARLEAIAGKIHLLQVAANLKELRILCITDTPILGLYEPTAYQTAEEGRETYEKKYLENLAALGAEIVVRPQEEMIARMEAASEAQVSEVAANWIAGAEGMRGTNEAQVKQSARLYLAMKEMLALYDANAVTTEGYGVFMYHEGGTIPSQGLPSSQFCTDGVVATSETLIDSLLTQQLGLWMTGSTGFNGDYVVDTDNNKAYIGHCECPLNPYGDEQMAPYVVRNLPQWPEDEQEKGGACVQVKLPVDEQVTVAKVGVHDKAMVVFAGETVDGESLFPGWEDILCRTKLAIDVDAKKLFEHLDWQAFGNHRVAFYGEHRQAFMDLATLLGFGVVEADK